MTIAELTDGPLQEVWHYLGRAPLSVVIAVSLVCTGASIAYTTKVASEDRKMAEDASARADRSERAAGLAEQKAAVAAATDTQTLASLNRIEIALRDLTAQVAGTNALVVQHLRGSGGQTHRAAAPPDPK